MHTNRITIQRITVTDIPKEMGQGCMVDVAVTVQGNRGPHEFTLCGAYCVWDNQTQLRWHDVSGVGGADLYAHLIGIRIPAYDWPGGHLRDLDADERRNTMDILRAQGGFQVAAEAVRPLLPLIRH